MQSKNLFTKWIIKLLLGLKGGHLQFLEFKKSSKLQKHTIANVKLTNQSARVL